MKGLSIEERFWAKVDKRGPDECWAWRAARDGDGYGIFWVNPQNRKAHRVAYELEHGMVPPADIEVCHSCDNPWCVNHAHLWLGTTADNMADRDAKGRTARGDRHYNTKLSSSDVMTLISSTERVVTLAKRYGVHRSYVYMLRRGKKRAYIPAAGVSAPSAASRI